MQWEECSTRTGVSSPKLILCNLPLLNVPWRVFGRVNVWLSFSYIVYSYYLAECASRLAKKYSCFVQILSEKRCWAMRHAVAVHNRRHSHVTQYRVVRLEGILCWTTLNLPCSRTYARHENGVAFTICGWSKRAVLRIKKGVQQE